MTKAQAEYLARHERTYSALQRYNGYWTVWCSASDHAVEFDQKTIDAARDHTADLLAGRI